MEIALTQPDASAGDGAAHGANAGKAVGAKTIEVRARGPAKPACACVGGEAPVGVPAGREQQLRLAAANLMHDLAMTGGSDCAQAAFLTQLKALSPSVHELAWLAERLRDLRQTIPDMPPLEVLATYLDTAGVSTTGLVRAKAGAAAPEIPGDAAVDAWLARIKTRGAPATLRAADLAALERCFTGAVGRRALYHLRWKVQRPLLEGGLIWQSPKVAGAWHDLWARHGADEVDWREIGMRVRWAFAEGGGALTTTTATGLRAWLETLRDEPQGLCVARKIFESYVARAERACVAPEQVAALRSAAAILVDFFNGSMHDVVDRRAVLRAVRAGVTSGRLDRQSASHVVCALSAGHRASTVVAAWAALAATAYARAGTQAMQEAEHTLAEAFAEIASSDTYDAFGVRLETADERLRRQERLAAR